MADRATPTRTRERSDAGVRRCVELMTSGLWVTGKSGAQVAEEFGVAEATVKDWATSASRVIRLAIEGDKEDIRARMIATLDLCIAKAMTKTGAAVGKGGEVSVYDAPDIKAAVSAVGEQAKILGLVAKTEMEVTLRAKQLEELPPDAMLAQVEDRIAKLTELRDKLRAELGVKKGKRKS